MEKAPEGGPETGGVIEGGSTEGGVIEGGEGRGSSRSAVGRASAIGGTSGLRVGGALSGGGTSGLRVGGALSGIEGGAVSEIERGFSSLTSGLAFADPKSNESVSPGLGLDGFEERGEDDTVYPRRYADSTSMSRTLRFCFSCSVQYRSRS